MELPGILAEIEDVAGTDAALAIAKACGGTQVYFPPIPTNDHWLCRLIGRDQARAVCERLTCGVGPLRVDVPLGPTARAVQLRAEVDKLLGTNMSERDIARRTGYTARAVRRRRQKTGIKPDDGQLPLL